MKNKIGTIKLEINLFFIMAFTMAILSFSIGISVISSYKEKINMYDTTKNKIVVFEDYEGFSLEQLLQVVKDDNITITLKNFIEDNKTDTKYSMCTILKEDSFNLLCDLSSGKEISSEEYKGNDYIGLFSLSMSSESEQYSINYFSEDTMKEIKLEKVGTTFETSKEVYVPNNVFFEVSGYTPIGFNQYTLVFSGNEGDLTKSISNLEKDMKSKKPNSSIVTKNYFIDDKSIEGNLIMTSSIIIVILTMINSIALTNLWIEEKKKELVLRKVCGANNSDLYKLYYKKLVSLSLMAMVISVFLHGTVSKVTNGILFGLDIRFTSSNFILAILISIILALVISLPSINYLSKIQPVELLRED